MAGRGTMRRRAASRSEVPQDSELSDGESQDSEPSDGEPEDVFDTERIVARKQGREGGRARRAGSWGTIAGSTLGRCPA